MSPHDLFNQPTEPMPVPCAACGESASAEVWDQPLCPTHQAAWFAEPVFENARIEARIPKGPWSPQHFEAETWRIYRDFTARWVTAQKARAA